MKVNNGNGIARFISSNAFQITAQILTVAGLLLGSYVTIRLYPLITHLQDIDFRVNALEKENIAIVPILPKIAAFEEHLQSIDQNIADIKKGQDTQNSKFDQFIINFKFK